MIILEQFEKFNASSISDSLTLSSELSCFILLIPRNHKPFRDVISTGLACGISFMHAFENALNECIERDAFMLFWLLGNIQYEININSIKNTKIATYLDCATTLNYDIKLYNISQPKLKTYTILSIFKTKGKKGFYMATSTNRNLFKAIQGSIEEGISGYTSFKEKIAFYGLVPPSTLDDIHSLEDHASYYVAGKYDEILPTIIKSDLQTKYIQDAFHEYTFDEMIESVSSVTNIYYTELTTVDISSLNLHCLRVITPKLLFLPYGNEPMLESERLYTLAKNKKINTIPHPFP